MYLAEDHHIGGLWAIKVVPIDRLEECAGIFKLVRVSHPNIVRVVDRITDEKNVYIVMDYVEGIPLGEYLRTHTLPTSRAIELSMELLDALRYLHGQIPPIVCGDLSPSNIMIRESGHLCLIDFDARPGQGTRGFAAPEQYQSLVDPRSDLYAAGALMQVMFSHPPRQIKRVIRRAMREKADDRYPDAAHMMQDLLSYGQTEGTRVRIIHGMTAAFLSFLLFLETLGVARAAKWEREIPQTETVASPEDPYAVIAEALIAFSSEVDWAEVAKALERIEEREEWMPKEHAFLARFYQTYAGELLPYLPDVDRRIARHVQNGQLVRGTS